jgi:hypothetical protein
MLGSLPFEAAPGKVCAIISSRLHPREAGLDFNDIVWTKRHSRFILCGFVVLCVINRTGMNDHSPLCN